MADPTLNPLALLERLRRRRPLVMVAVGLITFVSTAGVAVALWSVSRFRTTRRSRLAESRARSAR